MPKYNVDYSFLRKEFSFIDALEANNEEDMRALVEEQFKEEFMIDGEEISEFKIESFEEI